MSDVKVQMLFEQCHMKCKRFCRGCDGLLVRALDVSLELSLLELTACQGAIADLNILTSQKQLLIELLMRRASTVSDETKQ